MDIYDFSCLVSDDSAIVAIFDYTTEEEIFCGELRQASLEFGGYEIIGFDILRGGDDKRGVTLILNIETEEEEG